MKKIIVFLIIMTCSLFLIACAGEKKSYTFHVEAEPEFGGIYIKTSPEELDKLGFHLGDSIDVRFDNGYELTDVPIYNGYYSKIGMPLLCEYPGYPYPDLCINMGERLSEVVGVDESNTVEIRMNTPGAYKKVQDALGLVYTNNREDYESDEIFSNFRAMKGGSLRDDFIYRGASPCNNERGRAACTSGLCEKYGINAIFDISNDEEALKEFDENSDVDISYWKKLHQAGHVFPVHMDSRVLSQENAEKVVSEFAKILEEEGPFYIHCLEGKDRTGFVCMLLGILSGFSMDELAEDYLTTYMNYYHLSWEENSDKLQTIRETFFDDLLGNLCQVESVKELTDEKMKESARQYLEMGGMSEADISKLEDILCAE